MINEKEIWKFIPNCNEYYMASNFGNIKSLKNGKEKILKPVLKKNGYHQVSICVNGNVLSKRVHKLIASSFFFEESNKKMVVDHINNIKTDNRVENLQIITSRKNTSKDRKNKTSRYTGVCWDKQNNKWHSSISINNKRTHLGFFKCELKAHYIYIKKLKEIEND